MWHYQPDAFGFPAKWEACLSSFYAFFGFHHAEQRDCTWMQCKDMQTNRGSLCTHVHALQKELLKSHPWNLQSLSSVAELKVHVFKGGWNKTVLCAVEEALALCREIRAQDNREGLHERPNAESRAVWIISMLTVEMEREERKLGADGLVSVTGNYSVLQVGERPSDGWLPVLTAEWSRD